MTDHMPECPDTEQCIYDENDQCWVEHLRCICEELRACEERSYTLGIEVGKHDGWVAGHAAGVHAARDAVAALSNHYELCICDECCATQAALDAIDELRGES